MPRKNNRKHYEYEDRLGFNPNRYLASSHRNRSYGSTDIHSAVKAAQAAKRARRMLYDTKPSLDRHKARSSNRRKRRGFYMIRKMQRSADWAQRKLSSQRKQILSSSGLM